MNISFSTKPFNIVPYFQLQDERWFYQHLSHLLQFCLSPSSFLGEALEAKKKHGKGAEHVSRDVRLCRMWSQLYLGSWFCTVATLKPTSSRPSSDTCRMCSISNPVLLILGTLTNKNAEIWERNWNIWQLTDEHKNWGNRMAKNREAKKHRIS